MRWPTNVKEGLWFGYVLRTERSLRQNNLMAEQRLATTEQSAVTSWTRSLVGRASSHRVGELSESDRDCKAAGKSLGLFQPSKLSSCSFDSGNGVGSLIMDGQTDRSLVS